MKLACFNDNRLGVVLDDRVVDVSEALPHWGIKRLETHVEEVIEGFATYRPQFERMLARERGVPLAGVRLLAPIPRPPKILAAFVNYRDREGAQIGPVDFFYKASNAVVGPGGTVDLPDDDEVGVHHFEAELAYVIGRRAKHVSEAEAMDYVFGYLPFIDVSARTAPGIQRRTQLIGKGQDTFAPLGPYLVTKDEVPDPHKLRVRLWVNGELRQDYNTSDMAHYIPEQIAWLTKHVALEPGDVLATGTHHVGLGPVNGGDKVELEVERLGRLAVNVTSSGPAKMGGWGPGAQRQAPATAS